MNTFKIQITKFKENLMKLMKGEMIALGEIISLLVLLNIYTLFFTSFMYRSIMLLGVSLILSFLGLYIYFERYTKEDKNHD